MMSTSSKSAPARSTAWISSPRRAKSADSIEGAIFIFSSSLSQARGEKSVGRVPVRQGEKIFAAGHLPRARGQKVRGVLQGKRFVSIKKILHHALVFLRRERAGGVDQNAAGLQIGGRPAEDFLLQAGEGRGLRLLPAPLRPRGRPPNPQGGAGEVRQNPIVGQSRRSHPLQPG